MIKHSIEYARPSLDVDYDYVGIIDGLSDTDRSNFAITDELIARFDHAGVQTATARVNSRLELLGALETYRKEAASGKKFMLHFVAHGNDDGIASGGEFCHWEELHLPLQRIHTATNETLILNMSTCKGLHAIKITPPSGTYPFFGLIGASIDLSVRDALAANQRVYDKWIGGLPVESIVRETNREFGKELLFCISSQGYRSLSAQR